MAIMVHEMPFLSDMTLFLHWPKTLLSSLTKVPHIFWQEDAKAEITIAALTLEP